MMTLAPCEALLGPGGGSVARQAGGDAQTQRWEDEGGARRDGRGTPRPRKAAHRSHHFGEGQSQRTVTQDEQDRLAHSRQPASRPPTA